MSSDTTTSESESFFSNILKPGSSLDPRLLLILDAAFVALLFVFITLFVITSWNLHFLSLIFIELGLWGSVKWFVYELGRIPIQSEQEAKKVS